MVKTPTSAVDSRREATDGFKVSPLASDAPMRTEAVSPRP